MLTKKEVVDMLREFMRQEGQELLLGDTGVFTLTIRVEGEKNTLRHGPFGLRWCRARRRDIRSIVEEGVENGVKN